MFDLLKSKLSNKPIKLRCPCHCAQGTIILEFALDLPQSKPGGWLSDVEFSQLHLRTSKVTLHVIPVDMNDESFKVTASAVDAVVIIDGVRPTTESYPAIRERVRARLGSPPQTPGSDRSEKSFTAQGQTKKPGSHSHDKHK